MGRREGRGGWVLGEGLRGVRRAVREGWEAQPVGAREAWLRVMGVGLVGCCVLCVGITLGAKAWEGRGLGAWDGRVLERALQGPMSLPNAILVESFGNMAYLVPLVALSGVLALRAGRVLLGLTFPLGYLGARLAVVVGYGVWERPRPTLVADGEVVPGLHAFPSGHAAYALVAWGLLAWLWMRASASWAERYVAAGLLALVVGGVAMARMRMGAHWPSDILAGWIVGGAWLGVLVLAMHRAERAGGR